MPYVATPASDRASTLAEAAIRWDVIVARQPELEPVVSLQRELIGVTLDLLDAIGRLPRLSLPPRYLAAKLRRGVPALAREPVPIPVSVLEPGLLRLCRELGRGGWNEAADRLHATLVETRLDAASVLTMSLSRDQHVLRAVAVHHELSPDLLWLVSELAVSPYVCLLQRALLTPHADSELAASLDTWPHGYCPLCGSWPALAEAVSGRRVLRCSFCSLAWDLPRQACTYCGETGERFVRTPLEGLGQDRCLDVCDACAGYLKILEMTALSPFPLVAVSDLDTMDLDVAAMQRGYGRPVLKNFGLPTKPR